MTNPHDPFKELVNFFMYSYHFHLLKDSEHCSQSSLNYFVTDVCQSYSCLVEDCKGFPSASSSFFLQNPSGIKEAVMSLLELFLVHFSKVFGRPAGNTTLREKIKIHQGNIVIFDCSFRLRDFETYDNTMGFSCHCFTQLWVSNFISGILCQKLKLKKEPYCSESNQKL